MTISASNSRSKLTGKLTSVKSTIATGRLSQFQNNRTRLGQSDWRVRWPLLFLPLLMIALLYLLLRANQLNGVHAQSLHELNTLISDREQRSSEQTESSTNASNPGADIDRGFTELASNASKLQQWLSQGENTLVYAEHANILLRLLTGHNNSAAVLPSVEFWNEFSDVLTVLESGVSTGDISVAESSELITALRTQYGQLRSAPVLPANEVAALNQGAVEEMQAAELLFQEQVSTSVSELNQQRAQVTSLHNRALVVASLATLLLALLLWGLWLSAKKRRHSIGDKNQSEQTAILRLLDEISPLADGDLRVQATVSEASTGAVADAFNYAVQELRRLVVALTDSADMVRSSVHSTRESADQLAKASTVQAREILRSSNYLNVMSDTMAQLSAHAVESSRIAQLSVQQAQAGNTAVQANVDALSRIREQAENTSRLMQRLVVTSEGIQDRVCDIQTVAKRTDLLALNATIRASAQTSAVGVDGVNPSAIFTANYASNEHVSMLSDDIAHLAETLGRASRDISKLSELIQQDATITLRSVADTVNELDGGQRTALQASDNLHEIDRVSKELNGLIDDIASKSLRQAGVVKQLSANMGVINNITHDSTVQLQGSARSLQKLESITSELRKSVSDFKLPTNDTDNDSTLDKTVKKTPGAVGTTQHKNKKARSKAQDPVKHA